MNKRTRKRRFNRIANAIEKHPEHFDMNTWMEFPPSKSFSRWPIRPGTVTDVDLAHSPCGTTACICGWAVTLYPQDVRPYDSFSTAGQRILGFDSPDEASDLFSSPRMTKKSAKEVVNVLRRMADNL